MGLFPHQKKGELVQTSFYALEKLPIIRSVNCSFSAFA